MIKNDHKYKESKEWDYNIYWNRRNENHLKDRYCFKFYIALPISEQLRYLVKELEYTDYIFY